MRRLALLALPALVACMRVAPAPVPTPVRVEPAGMHAGTVARMRVFGTAFSPAVTHRLGGSTSADDRFHVFAGPRELSNVVWRGESGGLQLVEADAPADLPLGIWDVTVRDPSGSSGTLRAAFRVVDTAPGALAITGVTAPSLINRGQTFAITVQLGNTGATAVDAASAQIALAAAGGASAVASAIPGPQPIAPGATVALTSTFTESGAGPGTLTPVVSASGADALQATPLSASASGSAITVQNPASLTARWSVPGGAMAGSTVTTTLTLTNAGDATAQAVSVTAPQQSGTGGLTQVSSPPSSPITLPGGATATLTWTWTASTNGAVRLATNVSGQDATDGRTLGVTATSADILVGESWPIGGDPFNGDGTTFAYMFAYGGKVYLGPSATGSGAVSMNPDGSSPRPVPWNLRVDPAARNGAYQGSAAPACHTIGSLGCNPNSTACGPDNESGRGFFVSGVVKGTEWYVLSGLNPSGVRYLYATNATFPQQPGGYDDLAYVGIPLATTVRMPTAAHFFHDRLYLGFYDDGTTSAAPALAMLQTMPSLPGFTAGSKDFTDLGANAMSGVGSGSPGAAMIDAIADFNDFLYVANAQGWTSSTSNFPNPCKNGCPNWVNATPNGPDYTQNASVPAPAAASLTLLENWQRAVPGFATFGGRLFAARNTVNGPQLYWCNPAANGPTNSCDPGDWKVAARDASGLSTFGDPNNRSITLIAATASHLYVGFDNASGIQLYRTARADTSGSPPAPPLLSDFTGAQGCVAGTGGCTGIGGQGLGGGLSRIFDGKAFTFSGNEWLYVSAGDGVNGPRVYRLVP